MAYGSIDDQASPTNVKPMPVSRGNSGRAMGDIDDAASPPSQNSPPDPGKILGPIDNANYGGINTLVTVGMDGQCPGSTCTYSNDSFNDDVGQYMRASKDELNRVRNQAFSAVGDTQDNSNPPFIGRQDSDPKGG